MNNQRTAFIISAGAGIVATFLPYMKSFFNSVSLIETRDGTGYIIIIAFAISLIVSLLGDQKRTIEKGHLAGVIISGIIPGGLLLLFALGRSNNDFVEAFTDFEIGFYLVIIASLSILVISAMVFSENRPKPIRKPARTIFCSNCGRMATDHTSEFC
ncbi:MAG: hypothetical protein Q8T08_08765, partial [Ignavibacteria bacterium]|nr:hypothetical protein [Ignavibacteria bacterium]